MTLPNITEFDHVFSMLPPDKQEKLKHVKAKRDEQLAKIAEKVRKQNDKFGDFHRLIIARRCFSKEDYEDRKHYNEVREKNRQQANDFSWMNDVHKHTPSGKVYTTLEEVPNDVREPDIIDLDDKDFVIRKR